MKKKKKGRKKKEKRKDKKRKNEKQEKGQKGGQKGGWKGHKRKREGSRRIETKTKSLRKQSGRYECKKENQIEITRNQNSEKERG